MHEFLLANHLIPIPFAVKLFLWVVFGGGTLCVIGLAINDFLLRVIGGIRW